MLRKCLSPTAGPVIAAFSVAIAHALALGLKSFLPGDVLFIFVGAVIVSSLYAGLVAGVLSAFFAAFAYGYSFQFPPNSFRIESRQDVFQLIFFLAIALPLSYVGASMRKARREAERASRSREDVLAVVSHDLRNPLGVIRMSAEVAAMSLETDHARPAVEKSMAVITQNADRMTRMIADLLDYESIRAGKLSVTPKLQNIELVLQDTAAAFLPLAAQKSLTLEFYALNPSPSVAYDRDRLFQVFSNLLGNAFKFTPPGGSVTVRTFERGDRLEITVEDSGPGIPAADLPHIFDRYWQAQKTARQGAGLGLSIAQGIVRAHGGDIWAESVLGRGTCFHFTVAKGSMSELRKTRLAPPVRVSRL